MDVLHRFCMIIAGACLVTITLIIPWGVFTRYVLNSASSWPEPMAVLLMIWFSFLAASICYRENLHIGVAVIPMMLEGNARTRRRLADRSLHDGHQPVHVLVGHQAGPGHVVPVDRRFSLVSVGASYLPVPIGGLITALFVIERLWTSKLFAEPDGREHQRASSHRVARHGHADPDGRLRRAVPARHAGRLCARPCRHFRRAVDRPAARSGHAQDLRRHGRLRAARDPVLHPGGRHHGGRRHGRAPRQSCQGVRRLPARRAGAGQYPGLDLLRLHLGLVGRRHRLDRLGDDPADDQERLSAAVRRQRDDCRLAAAAADPALAQRGDLFACGRRHDLGRAPVHRRHHPGLAARAVADGRCASTSPAATTSQRARSSRSGAP